MSNRITIENYEAFLLDYSEGNLSSEAVQDLRSFLVLHPELEIDLNDLELPSLEDQETVFNGKNLLKKNIEFTEEDILSYLEGDLSSEQARVFEQELKVNASLRQQLDLFRKTILVPETATVYNGVSQLKKTEDDLVLNHPALMYLEGVMTEKDAVTFEKEMKDNSLLSAELIAYRKTKLQVDFSVVHPNKEELKKEAAVFFLFSGRNVIAYAASIALIVGLFFLFRSFNQAVVTPQGLAIQKQLNEPAKLDENTVSDSNGNASEVVRKEQIQTKETLLAKASVKVKKNNIQNTSVSGTNDTTIVRTALHSVDSLPAIAVAEHTKTLSVKENTLAVSVPSEEHQAQKQVILAYEEDNDDEATPAKKSGFWKRAVTVARQANQMGLKAVDGKEESSDSYLLSFNSFKLEKK